MSGGWKRHTTAQLEELGAAAIAAAAAEGLELQRTLHAGITGTGYLYVTQQKRAALGCRRYKISKANIVKASKAKGNFYTAEEAALVVARVLASSDVDSCKLRCRGNMTAAEALEVARCSGLQLDRATMGRNGLEHATGYRYITTAGHPLSAAVYRVVPKTAYVRAAHKKVPRGTYVRQPADSVALRDVWAPTTADSKAQRHRTAGGVPLPLVSARAPARKCSTTTVCTDVFHCKVAVLQRCQQILCQRISLNAAAFCAPFPNILTTRPHFFPRPNTFPMAHFLLSTA